MPEAGALQASQEACRTIARRAGGSFAAGMRLCPGSRREAMLVIYAWTRTADDLADEPDRPATVRRAQLEAFRASTLRALAGDPEPEGIWPAVADTAMSHGLDPRWFDDLIAGVASDIEPVQPETMDDLLAYCSRVASTVGLMCVRVWGLRGAATWQEAQHLAVRRGHALQLINVARDVGEDLRERPRRLYIPRQVMDAAGLDAEGLGRWDPAERCAGVVGALLDEAERALSDSRALAMRIDPACVPVLVAMSGVYRRMLGQLRAEPSRAVLGPRVRPGRARCAWIAGRAWIGAHLGVGRGA